jgi:PAS domain S-box-containing protein
MQTLNKRLGVISAFAFMLLLLAINAFTIRRQLAIQVGSQVWVAHTKRVLLELAETESLLKDAEVGQRGYLYTSAPQYLEPYKRASVEIPKHLETLTKLTSDNPGQRANMARLRDLTKEKLDELAQTITLAQAGKGDAAKQVVLSDRGLLTMNQIRRLLNEMSQQEFRLDSGRSTSYRRAVDGTISSIYLGTCLAAVGMILLGYYILREMELRQRHAQQLLEREEWFRVTLTSLGDAVIATDASRNVTYLNPLAERLIGIGMEEARGKAIREVFPIFNEATHKPVENPVDKVMELGRIVGLANHTVLQNKDGSFISIEDSAAPIRDSNNKLIGVVVVFRDAT